jgi:lambda family phage portal protein
MAEQSRPWYRRWLSAIAGAPRATTPTAPRLRALPSPRQRSYEAAQGGRLTAGWMSDANGPNTEIFTDLVKLRDRSRDLVRNNPIGARAMGVLGNALIGDGIRPQPATGSADLDAALLRGWEMMGLDIDANGRVDAYGMQRLAVHGWLESGEVLLRRRWRRPGDGLAVPMQIQLLEPDYIDDAVWSVSRGVDGAMMQYGIEIDAIGRRNAYRLFRQHPGETAQSLGQSLESVMVPASEVSHVYHVTRPGQLRGVPWLAPVMLEMRDLDDLEYTEMTRQKMQSCIMGARHSDNLDPVGNVNGDVEQDDDGDWNETMRPGTIIKLPTGESVEWFAPQQFGGFAEFAMQYRRGIAMGVSVPYEILTQDLTGTSYASIRAGLLEYQRMCSALSRNVIIPHICTPVWRWYVEAAELAGLLPAMTPMQRAMAMRPRWHTPQWIQVDRESTIKADILEMQAGTKTLEQCVAERGGDWMTVVAQLSAEQEVAVAAGLSLVGFGQVSPSQSVTMPADGASAPDATDAPAEDDAEDSAEDAAEDSAEDSAEDDATAA